MTLIDIDQRRQALTDLASTLLVEAAAGTGKTSLMAGRVALLLASGRKPREVAAITFTELAAAELAHRIRTTVEALLRNEIPKVLEPALPSGLSTEQKIALVAAAADLDELTATTLHGFCQTVVRSHAVAARLDPGSKVIDAPAADAMFETVFSRWLTERLSKVAAIADDAIAVLSRDNPMKVVELLRELAELKRAHASARTVAVGAGRPDVDLVDAVDGFARWHAKGPDDSQTGEIIADLQVLAGFYAGGLAAGRSFEQLWKLTHPPRVQAMKKNVLELLPYRRKSAWQKANGAEGAAIAHEAENHFDRCDLAYRNLLGTIAQSLITSVSTALDEVLVRYKEQKRIAAVLDFDDLLLDARDLVIGNESVRQALGERYRYIFVDEFQDTDPLQSEILFLIAASARPERWQDAVIKPGALFLVGDPKQAIYRFRGADIEVYNQARANVEGISQGRVLHVTANFRSQKGILDHVNSCFEAVLSRADQPGYVELSPTIDEVEGGLPCTAKVTIELPPGARIDEQRDAEAQIVADICSRLIGAVEIDRADGSRSPLKQGDIALLAPTGTELWRYERALEAKRISVASQAGKTLILRQETQDLLALLRALADPSDTLAFGAFMRGPLVGLTDNELLEITAALPNGFPFFTIRSDPETVEHPLAKAVLETLQGLIRRAPVLTPMALLSEAVELLHIRLLLTARHRNRSARAIANIDALIERARTYSVSGLQAFVEELNRDWELKTRIAEGRTDISENAVELVTMHSSKGLEWPVVIPINTGTRFRQQGQFVHRRLDDTLQWVLGGVEPPDLAQARAEEEASEARQRERMWYVACTRARDILIIPNLVAADSRSWSRTVNLGHDALPELNLDNLPEAAADKAVAGSNTQTAAQFTAEAETIAASSAPINWKRPSDHDPDRPVIDEGAISALSETADITLPAGPGRLRGIVLHKLMEEFLTGELLEDEPAAVARARTLFDQLVADEADTRAAPDPTEMGRTALNTLRIPEIAALRHHLVPEVAIWASAGTEYVAGRADALAVDKRTVTAALDWKSDVHPSADDRSRYLGQVRDYQKASCALRAGVVYMTLGEVDWA